MKENISVAFGIQVTDNKMKAMKEDAYELVCSKIEELEQVELTELRKSIEGFVRGE